MGSKGTEFKIVFFLKISAKNRNIDHNSHFGEILEVWLKIVILVNYEKILGNKFKILVKYETF